MLELSPLMSASIADKVLMIILGLTIVVPTIFIVVAVMFARSRDQDD